MFRREGLPIAVKRILLAVVVLVTALLQNTDGFLPVFFGARIFLLIPLIISIGMLEGEVSGLVYGLIGGAFWDVCSSGIDGWHAFYLAFIGCLSGVLIHYIMRSRLLTEYCICGIASVIHCVVYWLFTVYIPLGDMEYKKLLGFYLPSTVVTTAFSFIVFYIIKLISVSLTELENKTENEVI